MSKDSHLTGQQYLGIFLFGKFITKEKSILFYQTAKIFCFHLSGSNSRYLLSGVLGGSAAALLMTSDI